MERGGRSPPALCHEFCAQPPGPGIVPLGRSGSRLPPALAPQLNPGEQICGASRVGVPWEPCQPLHAGALLRPLKARFLQVSAALASKARWDEESKTVPSLCPAASCQPSAALWDPPAPSPAPVPCLHAINWECLGVTSPVTSPRPGRATCFGRSAFSDCDLAIARERGGRVCAVCLQPAEGCEPL